MFVICGSAGAVKVRAGRSVKLIVCVANLSWCNDDDIDFFGHTIFVLACCEMALVEPLAVSMAES